MNLQTLKNVLRADTALQTFHLAKYVKNTLHLSSLFQGGHDNLILPPTGRGDVILREERL